MKKITQESIEEMLGHLLRTNGLTAKFQTRGEVIATLFEGPNPNEGLIKQIQKQCNLVTTYGDQYCATLVAEDTITSMAEMRLGTDNTAASKSQTGLVNEIANSDDAFESGYPQYLQNPSGFTSGEYCMFRCEWGAGDVTNSNIYEVGIFESGGTNMTARAVFGSAINKTANDTLRVDWGWAFLGA